MKSTNQIKPINLLKSILQQRIKIESLGVSRKNNSRILAAKAGDFLNHISMFESDGQVKSFVRKNIYTIFEISVNPENSKTLQKLIDLTLSDDSNYEIIKSLFKISKPQITHLA